MFDESFDREFYGDETSFEEDDVAKTVDDSDDSSEDEPVGEGVEKSHDDHI